MSRSTSPTILGLDVHKNTISAAILRPGVDVADVEEISSDDDAVRRLVGRLGRPRELRACYEAGPTGYELARAPPRPWGGHGGDRSYAHPDRGGRSREDRLPRLPAPGSAVSGRGAGRHPHPHRGRGGGPGSVPSPGRHGHRPHPGPASAREVPAAPRSDLAGWRELDP